MLVSADTPGLIELHKQYPFNKVFLDIRWVS